MTTTELINHGLVTFTPESSLKKALKTLDSLNISYLPVVDNGKFLGMASFSNLSDMPDLKGTIGQIRLDGTQAFVFESQHFFDILATAKSENTTVVAVLNQEEKYLGAIWLIDILRMIGDSYSFKNPGGILVFSMNAREYSLAEISRLVESNDAKIIGLLLEEDKEEPEKLVVTIKVNKDDLTRIISTFERYKYLITNTFHRSESKSLDKERLDLLLKYLSI